MCVVWHGIIGKLKIDDSSSNNHIPHRGLVAVFSQSHEACRRANRHSGYGFRQVRTMDKSLLPLEDVVNDDVVAGHVDDRDLIRKRDRIRAVPLHAKDKSVR